MAEVLLRDRFERLGVDATVSSAGTVSEGRPASGGAVEAMRERGLDLSGHRSRLLTPELVQSADLVVGMAREHVREATVACPGRFGRIFTLKELVRLGEGCGARRSESIERWLDRVGMGRKPASLLGPDSHDDVADPIGQPLAVYQAAAAEIDDLVDRLADLLWAHAAAPADGAGREPGARVASELGEPEPRPSAARPAVEPRPEPEARAAPIGNGAAPTLRVAVGSDHAGFALKAHLIEVLTKLGHEVLDVGTHGPEPVDYPGFCAGVGRAVTYGAADRGIVVGGSGQGEQLAANTVPGVRAALCNDLFTARFSRAHNDANVLSMGARVVGEGLAEEIVATWLATTFDGGRHQRRVDQLTALEAAAGDRKAQDALIESLLHGRPAD
ncbi:MAG: ribose 5-phosphate isomerase B [Actinobacteria bacterium]|nr:ribose 5-phosphate isomerase B [Actinomycetota bacterium]